MYAQIHVYTCTHFTTVPSESTPLPRPGAVDFSATAGEDDSEVLEEALQRLSDRVEQRRVLTKPCFQDFDR